VIGLAGVVGGVVGGVVVVGVVGGVVVDGVGQPAAIKPMINKNANGISDSFFFTYFSSFKIECSDRYSHFLALLPFIC
jgi:hypothetical protein